MFARPIHLLALVTILMVTGRAAAQLSGPASPDKVMQRVNIDQRLGEHIPLDLAFVDEAGKNVALGDYFGSKPVVLALVYYKCPMLCTMTLNGMLAGFKPLNLTAGKDFEVVVISFDHRETPELAAQKKATYLAQYDRPGAEAGWHFLTGTPDSIKRITDAVGFNYYFDTRTAQFAHASGIQLLTPTGKLARYFYGLEYSSRDLSLSLVEASENKIGTLAEKITLLCYQYDPTTGKYGLAVMRMLRIGAGLTVAALVTMWFTFAHRHAKPGTGIPEPGTRPPLTT